MSQDAGIQIPLVSIVVPAYNYGRFLADAIESVLAQTFKKYELIVIDDGSTDNTPDIVKPYEGRIRYHRQTNQGLSATRNRGAYLARGKYLAFLDADDEWLPDKLEVQVRILENRSDVAMVTSSMTLMDARRNSLEGLKPSKPPGVTFDEIVRHGTAVPSSFIVRKDCFEALDGFDTNLAAMEDLDFGLRLAARYAMIHLQEPLGRYRIHGPSLSQSPGKVYPSYIRIFERLLLVKSGSVPAWLVRERLAHYRYLWGKHLILHGRISEGRPVMRSAFAACPFFGWKLDATAPAWRWPLNTVKVYLVIALAHLAPGLLSKIRKEPMA